MMSFQGTNYTAYSDNFYNYMTVKLYEQHFHIVEYIGLPHLGLPITGVLLCISKRRYHFGVILKFYNLVMNHYGKMLLL